MQLTTFEEVLLVHFEETSLEISFKNVFSFLMWQLHLLKLRPQ